MKLPNGYWSVTKLKGRRRPYWVKKTVGFDTRGYPVVKTIGYYTSYAEGLNALAEYNRNPYDLDVASITFRDGFERWYKEYLATSEDLAESTKYTHLHSLDLCKRLHLIAGEKTKEGRNRAIPIHPLIRPIVDTFTFNSHSVKYWEYKFKKLLPGHTPHDTRRTFISRSVECGMADVACRKIVGHVGKDIHEKSYTFLTPEYLYEEIQKLCY